MLSLAATVGMAADDNKASVTIEEAEWEGTVTVSIPIAILLPGDANGDGTVNATDIVETVNYILHKPSDIFIPEAANVNGDEVIDGSDVQSITDIIMDKQ